jgi:protein-S-isoprenylcysteine O-methyltransferase Ste14
VTDGARVLRIPPPLYYGVAFAAGSVLAAKTVFLPIGVPAFVGAIVLALGAAMAIAGVVTVVRSHSTIIPHHAVSALVTRGIYRITRNPMYTGLAIAYLGGTLLLGSWWPAILFPLVIVVVRFVVIGPEEQYLSTQFGPVYAAYRANVRRWL